MAKEDGLDLCLRRVKYEALDPQIDTPTTGLITFPFSSRFPETLTDMDETFNTSTEDMI